MVYSYDFGGVISILDIYYMGYEDLKYYSSDPEEFKINKFAMKILDSGGTPDWCNYKGACSSKLKKKVVNFYKQRQVYRLMDVLAKGRKRSKRTINSIKKKTMKKTWKKIDKYIQTLKKNKGRKKNKTRKKKK